MTSSLFIIPVEVDNAITAELDRFLALHPEREPERAKMRSDLLMTFDMLGVVATLAPKDGPDA